MHFAARPPLQVLSKGWPPDGLKLYPAALKQLGIKDRRRMGRWLNKRAENAHLPSRVRERGKQRFRRMKTLRKFGSVNNHFNLERHVVDRQTYKTRRSAAWAKGQIFVT